MHKIVIILYGQPGSGKGTQANLLAQKLNLIHFDTGKYLESVINDPKRQKSGLIRREKRLFDGGKLMTPSFVLNEVKRATERIAKAGWGLVFSGSPRTVYEAEGLFPVLQKLYGRQNIFIFELGVSEAESIKRNSNRLLCTVCGYGLLAAFYPTKNPKFCPVCGGSFYRRSLDKPEVIKVRLREYHNRTAPIFKVAKRFGYKVTKVNAAPAPSVVLKKVLQFIIPKHLADKLPYKGKKISALDAILLASGKFLTRDSRPQIRTS